MCMCVGGRPLIGSWAGMCVWQACTHMLQRCRQEDNGFQGGTCQKMIHKESSCWAARPHESVRGLLCRLPLLV